MSLSNFEFTDTLAAGVDEIARQAGTIVDGGTSEHVTDATITKLLTAAALLYAARVETGGDNLPATTPGALNATQGMIVTSGIMKSVNLQVFELGLWQTWAQGPVAR